MHTRRLKSTRSQPPAKKLRRRLIDQANDIDDADLDLAIATGGGEKSKGEGE